MEPLNPASTSPPNGDNNILPIFDAFLDLPHPAASEKVNAKRIIIAPPPGEAFARSKNVGIELATETGIARVASFCFPEFHPTLNGKRRLHDFVCEYSTTKNPLLMCLIALKSVINFLPFKIFRN